jgi:uncharacterized protein YaaR (DUF327 family)
VDKIDSPGNTIPFFNPGAYGAVRTGVQKTKDKAAVRNVKKAPFSQMLETQDAEGLEALPDASPSEDILRNLLDDVHSAGDALKQRPLAEEIKQYKKAVRHFLHYVVENGYTLEEHTGIPKFLRPGFRGTRSTSDAQERKKYTLIQVVDQRLDQLATAVLSGQTTQVELLARLDEITGLLVDLMQ